MGISAVSAEDINQTDVNLEITDSDVMSVDEPKSFTDLSNDISDNPFVFDVNSDYAFNNQTDKNFTEGIKVISQPDGQYTINGNNHVIDAKNQAGIFNFINGTVYINNLKLVNGNMSAIVLGNCKLHTYNVTFENNHDSSEGGAVFVYGSEYYSSHDKFINNYGNRGAAIFSSSSPKIEIDNSTFSCNKTLVWGLIYGEESDITVKNTIFTNMSSRYATAIYSDKSRLTVLNSKFINLFANATAGAIGGKEADSIVIDGCSFINVTSSKNAGAIYLDMISDNKYSGNPVTVSNSLFENCSSDFGGAVLQLGGALSIVKTNFINNVATYMGGAVYVSTASVLMSNSKFNGNAAKDLVYSFGGALYLDKSSNIIASCEFTNNNATTGNSIYLYDSKYNIRNSYFSKGNNEAIVSFFDAGASTLKDNEFNGGRVLLNQSFSNTIVEYEGKQFTLNPLIITNATASSDRFDLRDYYHNGYCLAGVVKDQGNNGACWAFGATGALESAFLKATGILLDLSENNIQDVATRYNEYGTLSISEAGYGYSGMGLFLSWIGILSKDLDSYDELGKISIATFSDDSYHIQNSVIIPPRESPLDNSKLKEALINYGGLTVHLYGASANNKYYNPVTHAQYYNGLGFGNHFVTLVGWDDNYSKDNFKIKPKGDGAWICKNSWGTDWGENGFFYVSYYDTTMAMSAQSYGYVINSVENYTKLYQYDIGAYDRYLYDEGKIITCVNTYDATGNDLISAVGTYFEKANDAYTIKVYVDGNEVYTQTGKSSHGGFETIKLNKKIAVNAGHQFSIEIQAKRIPILEDTRLHFNSGKSIVYFDDETDDLGKLGKIACIKAYAVPNPNPEKSNSRYYTKDSNLTIYSTANGKTILIMKDNDILGSAIVNDGKATFDLTLDSGTYVIVTPYGDEEVLNGFEIMKSIDIPESVKIGYKYKLILDSTFYDGEGIELFFRDIPAELDGKTYNFTIENNEGVLSLSLSNLAIGTHTLILKNPETLEQSVTTIKVVSRFSGNSNVKMYYGDGSTYKVRVYGNNGAPVGANKIVTIKFNKVTYKVKTNSKGYAIFKIPYTAKPGIYTLFATYGQTIKNTINIKQVLTLQKVNVKKSAKQLVIKATLKNGKTPIKNKVVRFNFNGKAYSVKSDKYGVAKITVTKALLNKLKVGKVVTYQATYIKNTVKQSVKVTA